MDDIEQAIHTTAHELQVWLQHLQNLPEKPQESQETLPRLDARQVRTRVAQTAIYLATLIIKMDKPQEANHLWQQIEVLNGQISEELVGEYSRLERPIRPPWLTF